MRKIISIAITAATILLLCSCAIFSGDKNKLNANDLVRYYYKVHNGYSGMSRVYVIIIRCTTAIRECPANTKSSIRTAL